MSLHEVTVATSSIMKRKEIEMRFQAKCLGAETDEKQNDSPIVEKLNDKQKQAMNRAIEEHKKKRGV